MQNDTINRLIELLEEAEGQVNNDIPPLEMIADYLLENGVFPVVRCKDCKHCIDYGMSGLFCNHADDRNPLGCRPDDYCSYGERK